MFVPLWRSQFFMDLAQFVMRHLSVNIGYSKLHYEAEIEVECCIYYIGHR